MGSYRKKPVVVEAEQYWPLKKPWPKGVFRIGWGRPKIKTLEGDLYVTPGDWIITGIKGGLYPCKPDIFEATYDEVTP